MAVYNTELSFSTEGDGTILDLTDRVAGEVAESGISNGAVTVFVPGSTGAVTTVEYEQGLLKDLPEFFERIIPSEASYRHDETWGDGNGFSHLRASLVGPSLTVPISSGSMILGRWQQIVFLDFDNRPRSRRIQVNIIGD